MNSRYQTCVNWLAAVSVAAYVGLVGCAGENNGFISDNPKGPSPQTAATGGEGNAAASGSTGSGGGGGGMPGANDDAERAIAEADIIQIKDNKLYALSQYAGLSIIDISVKDKLTLVGRYRVAGMPFEMYLRDGIVYAMFSSWGQSLYDDVTNSWSWVESSRIEALDVTQPAAIHSIGSFDLPGAISDSRIVGDVLYAVTFENGYCWGCKTTRNTTVTSLSVADPATI